jgi:hypothetical protein
MSIQEATTRRIQQSAIREGKGGRSWKLQPIIVWYYCRLIAVAVVGGVGGGAQHALSVRGEEELPSSCAATNADNDYDD